MPRNLRLSIEEYERRFGAKAVEKSPLSPPAPNKHGAVATMRGAIRFDSKIEARLWDDFRLRLAAGQIDVLQRQVTFVFTVDDVRIGHYKADFVYRIRGEAHLRVADCKSAHTRTLSGWARTRALMRACYQIEVEEL